MSCRGVHYALTDSETTSLRTLRNDRARKDYLIEVIEERDLGGEWAAETDKAWDAIHRCFANGRLSWKGGDYPLNHIILCGEQLYKGADLIMSLKSPVEVRDIAAKIKDVSHEHMRARYFQIDSGSYEYPLCELDYEYTWEWFAGLVDFYKRAAAAGRFVLFTADQ